MSTVLHVCWHAWEPQARSPLRTDPLPTWPTLGWAQLVQASPEQRLRMTDLKASSRATWGRPIRKAPGWCTGSLAWGMGWVLGFEV